MSTPTKDNPMRQAWKRSGLQQREIAELAKCSAPSVNNFINGSLRTGPVWCAIYDVLFPTSIAPDVPISPEAEQSARTELALMLADARQRLRIAESETLVAREDVARLENVASRYPAEVVP